RRKSAKFSQLTTSSNMMTNSFSTQATRNGYHNPGDLNFLDEIQTCRAIAHRCAFVIGPGRSGTTILAQIINGNDRAFLTTEANHFEAANCPDFRSWYNEKHVGFGNQICKMSYAPNFVQGGEQEWWKWLARAAEHFDLVGDKVAISDVQYLSVD